jgi:hypothetical protein
MDYTKKGILLEYERDYAYKEGIFAYDVHLYAELLDGTMVDVGLTKSPGDVDDRNVNPLGINESWSSSKMSNLDITIVGHTFHEAHGYYTAGWNNLFSTIQTIDNSTYPDEEAHKTTNQLDHYRMLPLSYRDDNFASVGCIGIARDMHTVDKNMVGSYGRMDHTITHIYLNDKEKPFVIEYYG